MHCSADRLPTNQKNQFHTGGNGRFLGTPASHISGIVMIEGVMLVVVRRAAGFSLDFGLAIVITELSSQQRAYAKSGSGQHTLLNWTG